MHNADVQYYFSFRVKKYMNRFCDFSDSEGSYIQPEIIGTTGRPSIAESE